MSVNYQALYRKYRSQTFGDLVGQEATSRALQGAIISGRVAHAYLFSGTRGTGKTSTARLLAKALNCPNRQPGSAEPCNECPSCQAVADGAALDLIEIDAASNRGIDEIRDLREKVHLAPSQGVKKIYIIDEAHMLTQEAFNALLKTLEEPPEHVVFVLCTTDANKIPATVLGRCQQFVFRRFNDDQIESRLQFIAEHEGFQVDPEALHLVAHVAQGSMRDAQSLLDQLLPLSSGQVTLDSARELLGMADPARIEELLDDVLNGRAGEALELTSSMYAGGAELRQVVRALMESTRDRLVVAIDQRDADTRSRLSQVLDGLLHLDGEVRRHAEPRFLVEATLVKLAVEVGMPGVAPSVPAVPADLDRAAPVAPLRVPVSTASPPTAQRPAAQPPAPAAPASAASAPAASAPAASAPAASAPAAPPPAASAPDLIPLPDGPPPDLGDDEDVAPAPPAVNGSQVADVGREWAEVVQSLSTKAKACYREAEATLEGGTNLVVVFRYAFHHKLAQEHMPEVLARVRRWLGDGARIDVQLQPASAGPKPRRRMLSPEEAPIIQEAVRKLEGRVVSGVHGSHAHTETENRT